jgi:hypothetical protein
MHNRSDEVALSVYRNSRNVKYALAMFQNQADSRLMVSSTGSEKAAKRLQAAILRGGAETDASMIQPDVFDDANVNS